VINVYGDARALTSLIATDISDLDPPMFTPCDRVRWPVHQWRWPSSYSPPWEPQILPVHQYWHHITIFRNKDVTWDMLKHAVDLCLQTLNFVNLVTRTQDSFSPKHIILVFHQPKIFFAVVVYTNVTISQTMIGVQSTRIFFYSHCFPVLWTQTNLKPKTEPPNFAEPEPKFTTLDILMHFLNCM
jgi:hypothetical protein